MKAPIARCMLLLLILSACTTAPRRIYIGDTDFVEVSRQYSPDRAMLILDYTLDIGALGYSNGGTAVLRISDLTKDLTQFNLPDNLEQVKWIDNKTISARIDVIGVALTCRKRFTLSPTILSVPNRALQSLRG